MSAYWKRFNEALEEAEKVVLVGYSGHDVHLNEIVRSRCRMKPSETKPIYVIEWHGNEDLPTRQEYWEKNLEGCDIRIKHLDNILKIYDWNNL